MPAPSQLRRESLIRNANIRVKQSSNSKSNESSKASNGRAIQILEVLEWLENTAEEISSNNYHCEVTSQDLLQDLWRKVATKTNIPSPRILKQIFFYSNSLQTRKKDFATTLACTLWTLCVSGAQLSELLTLAFYFYVEDADNMCFDKLRLFLRDVFTSEMKELSEKDHVIQLVSFT